MSYAKLFGTITDSSLWSASKDARILFVSMLARADSTGFVEAALPGLARLANLTLQETEAALADLMSPDPHSKSPDHEGRRVVIVPRGWCLVNYEAYRERRNDEERREYMREYMQKYRKQPVSKKVNMLTKCKPCKPPLANTETETETETEKRNIDGAKAPKQKSEADILLNQYPFKISGPKRGHKQVVNEIIKIIGVEETSKLLASLAEPLWPDRLMAAANRWNKPEPSARPRWVPDEATRKAIDDYVFNGKEAHGS